VAERFDRLSGLLELIRWQGRGLRDDYAAGRGLLEACFTAVEVGVPEDFVTAGICILEAATERMGASTASIPADFPEVFERRQAIENANRRELSLVRQRLIDARFPSDNVLLLGDPGVLLGVFRSLAAFRAQTWAIGVPGVSDHDVESVAEQAIMALPFEVRFGRLGYLEDRLESFSELVDVDGVKWRVPDRELLVVLLAARVGEPEASPATATWAQLAAALKGMRDEIELDEIMELADGLDLTGRVHRGLAVVCSVFPELGRIIPDKRLEIPAWERVALRVAATRLVKTAVADED
jgi:hypothetical protein